MAIGDKIGELWDRAKTFVSGKKEQIEDVKEVINEGASLLADTFSAIEKEIPNITSTAMAALATPSYRGTMGNYATYQVPISLRAKFLEPVAENFDNAGRPVCRVMPLTSLSGFTLVENPQITFSCFVEEEEILKSFMSSGFYIE